MTNFLENIIAEINRVEALSFVS